VAINHPALKQVQDKRMDSRSLRVADSITAFAGSMTFVYIHIAFFALWIVALGYLLKGDPYPFGLLTLVVSLEAIFLSTFVMIGQNRAADLAAAKADHDFTVQQALLQENTRLTVEIHKLTVEMHRGLNHGDASPTD
jgi:uncharacterized membrane protein